MAQKRKVRLIPAQAGQPTVAPAAGPKDVPEAPASDKPASRMPLFWRLFGGAAVAAVAVVGVAIYQHVRSQISSQRRELAALNKASSVPAKNGNCPKICAVT